MSASDGNPWLRFTRVLLTNGPWLGPESDAGRPPAWDDFSDEYFIDILAGATSLTDLNLLSNSHFVELALSPSVASLYLPNLTSLRFATSLPQWYDPFHPAFYATLPCYHHLRKLRIEVKHPPLDIQRAKHPITPLSFSIPDLKVEGFFTQNEAISSFLSSFPRLVRLSIKDLSPTSHLDRLLSAIPSPALLEDLTLSLSTTPMPHLHHHLSLFPNLRILGFGGCTMTAIDTAPFLQTLRQLPLERLKLAEGVTLNFPLLSSLISGPSPHPTLRHIAFDVAPFVGEACSIVDHDGRIVSTTDGADAVTINRRCWRLPEWWDRTTSDESNEVHHAELKAGLSAFRALADKRRIVVSGDIDQGIEVVEAFLRELEILKAYEAAVERGETPRTLGELGWEWDTAGGELQEEEEDKE